MLLPSIAASQGRQRITWESSTSTTGQPRLNIINSTGICGQDSSHRDSVALRGGSCITRQHPQHGTTSSKRMNQPEYCPRAVAKYAAKTPSQNTNAAAPRAKAILRTSTGALSSSSDSTPVRRSACKQTEQPDCNQHATCMCSGMLQEAPARGGPPGVRETHLRNGSQPPRVPKLGVL